MADDSLSNRSPIILKQNEHRCPTDTVNGPLWILYCGKNPWCHYLHFSFFSICFLATHYQRTYSISQPGYVACFSEYKLFFEWRMTAREDHDAYFIWQVDVGHNSGNLESWCFDLRLEEPILYTIHTTNGSSIIDAYFKLPHLVVFECPFFCLESWWSISDLSLKNIKWLQN